LVKNFLGTPYPCGYKVKTKKKPFGQREKRLPKVRSPKVLREIFRFCKGFSVFHFPLSRFLQGFSFSIFCFHFPFRWIQSSERKLPFWKLPAASGSCRQLLEASGSFVRRKISLKSSFKTKKFKNSFKFERKSYQITAKMWLYFFPTNSYVKFRFLV